MKLALELQARKQARLVPVLLERIRDYDALPLGKLQALPSGKRPISTWRDRVRALDDVGAGIRKAAMSWIIDRGGPFEFGSHQFTEAELADLEPRARVRALGGLKRLREALVLQIPRRRLERNLLMASWCLRKPHGNEVRRLDESPFYMAQVLSSFDVISLQEIDRRMNMISRVIDILGPEWRYFITDVNEGPSGNNERLGILYYQPRIAFEHIAGEVVLTDNMLIHGKQFARKPLLASLRIGRFPFRICSAHIYYGSSHGKRREHALEECRRLAQFLLRVAKRDGVNIVLAGDFNMIQKDSDAVRAFKKCGFQIPPRILHPSNIGGDKYYDMIGLFAHDEAAGPKPRIGRSGAFNPFDHVFRDSDARTYAALRKKTSRHPNIARHETWRTYQVSDHRVVWLELRLPADRAKNSTGGRRS